MKEAVAAAAATAETSLDSQLWHACAGGMVQMPPVNSTVFYFPQGHAEHAAVAAADLAASPRVPPPLVLCRVARVSFLADSETDEVFAKLRLVPLPCRELGLLDDDDGAAPDASCDGQEKPPSSSFAKTLTQSDANNGGGFSVPRYCAETIFPRLDYTADPPVQTVVARDVHGDVWKFRHIYRGTPRRHLLTTGWSTFVNQKKLVAGDSIVFLRTENGDLCVGIRRAKRGGMGGGGDGGGPDSALSGWNSAAGNCISQLGGLSALLREEEGKLMRNGRGGSLNPGGGATRGRGRIRPESVVEAAALAANGQPFEVIYYPRASTPEFCVKASAVRAAVRTNWCAGMRFKMPFETEDSSRISWFMGTISSVQVADPIRWPNSPWRLLQVTWDEPDLLQNVKRVSPWLVELVSNMPIVHISPFSPPRKKLRLPQHPDFTLDGQYPIPSFSGNPLRPSSPLCCLSDNTPAGIQGARHAQFGISFTDFQLYNKLQSGLFQSSFQQFDQPSARSSGVIPNQTDFNENISCLLTIGSSSQKMEKSDNAKKPLFLLFGQPILTEQQISRKSEAFSKDSSGKTISVENLEKTRNLSDGLGSTLVQCSPPEDSFSLENHDYGTTELGLDAGHCKVFLESEDVGRTLDLSALRSYEELHRRLANMFGMERLETVSHVLYRDATGAVKHTGDEPFSEFMRTAKRLTILLDSGRNDIGKAWITGSRNAENGLNSTNKAGPLSIFA